MDAVTGAGWDVERANLAGASDDHIAELYVQAVKLAVYDLASAEDVLAVLDAAEIDRQFDDESAKVDELTARGWTYVEAYADVHGLDPAKLQRDERLADVRRARNLHGGTAELHTRAMYREEIAERWRAAEQATDGHMLNMAGRAAALDPRRKAPVDGLTLFSGPVATARKYASDELRAWWEAHGGRVTYAEWLARLVGDRTAVRAAAQVGAGRDYGV